MNANVKPEAAAAQLLVAAGIKSAPVDVERLAAHLRIPIEKQVLESSVSGCLVRSESDAVTMIVNRLHHPNRQRFTMAHELGHFVLHGNHPSLFIDDMMVHFRAQTSKQDPQEIEANAFAAALLMPEHLLRKDLASAPLDPFDDDAVIKLAKRYGVSAQSLTIRLVQTGLVVGIDPAQASKRRRPSRAKTR